MPGVNRFLPFPSAWTPGLPLRVVKEAKNMRIEISKHRNK